MQVSQSQRCTKRNCWLLSAEEGKNPSQWSRKASFTRISASGSLVTCAVSIIKTRGCGENRLESFHHFFEELPCISLVLYSLNIYYRFTQIICIYDLGRAHIQPNFKRHFFNETYFQHDSNVWYRENAESLKQKSFDRKRKAEFKRI